MPPKKTNKPKSVKAINATEKKLEADVQRLEKALAKTKVAGKKSKAKGPSSNTNWLSAMSNPFGSYFAHIPDIEITDSALLWSEKKGVSSSNALSGTSTVHSTAILMMPYPKNALAFADETVAGGGTLSFTDTAGTSYRSLNDVPNITSLTGGTTSNFGAAIRCVGMGLKLSYVGTELNRSANVYAGFVCFNRLPTVVTTTGTVDCIPSMIGNATGVSITTADLKAAMKNCKEGRIPSDGELVFTWHPNGVPTYQVINQATYVPVTGRSAGVSGTTSGFYTLAGQSGLQEGISNLAILIEGDTTSSATATANNYDYTARWLWEVVPDQPEAIAAKVTPSKFDPAELQKAINGATKIPVMKTNLGIRSF